MFITVAIFIITLLILVIVHELGHFLMAKRFGIKVEEFGFGIPPRAWGKKIGETIYSINWLPFGGFVKLLGEDETDEKVLKNKDSFAAQKVWKRIMVVIAGVTMNLVMAWVLFYIVLLVQNFRIIYPTPDPIVQVVEAQKGLPAENSGIKSGERLLVINDQFINSVGQSKEIIKNNAGKKLKLVLSDLDGNNLRTVFVTPQNFDGQVIIGVVFSQIGFREYKTPVEKIFSGITYSWDLTRLSFIGLGKLISDISHGQLSAASKSVAGPVGLATITNSILSQGLEAAIPYLWFTGVISLTLAIMNFLPIPALDGGRLLFLYIEAITRRKVKPEIERYIHAAGFALLITLMLLVTMSDIRKLILGNPFF